MGHSLDCMNAMIFPTKKTENYLPKQERTGGFSFEVKPPLAKLGSPLVVVILLQYFFLAILL